MDAVILARPTKSLTLHIQQSMRPMRPDPNNPDKIATIIDYVKNFEMLGLPDTPRQWSLAPNRTKGESVPPFKICPRCKEVTFAGTRTCKKCGFNFPFGDDISGNVGNLKQYSNLSIEHFLQLADKKGYKKYWAVIRALEYVETFEEVEHIAKVMGFKSGWAWYQWQQLKQQRNS
jgi:superfamily II DNA or RNA helicase